MFCCPLSLSLTNYQIRLTQLTCNNTTRFSIDTHSFRIQYNTIQCYTLVQGSSSIWLSAVSHFATLSDLASLTFSAVAAPALQARETSDQTGASSVESSPAASDETGAAASAKASLLSLGTSDSTDSTSDSSDSTAGSTDSTSTGSNQTLLYGPDSRPNITHLAASMSFLSVIS
jgi:hypothetical protein